MRRLAALALLLPLAAAADMPADAPATPRAAFPSHSAEPLPDADRTAAAALDAKLDAPVTTRKLAPDTPLREALRAIADGAGAGLVVDEEAVTDDGVNLDGPVAAEVAVGPGPVSARTVLGLLTEPKGLAVLNRAGLLVVTTKAKADERLTTRVYDIRGLLEGVPEAVDLVYPDGGGMGLHGANASPAKVPGPPRTAEARLKELVPKLTAGPWFEIHGVGGTLDFYDGLLAVRQTDAMHAEVAAVLGAMRQARAARGGPPAGHEARTRPAELEAPARPADPEGPADLTRAAEAALDAKLGREVGPVALDDSLRNALAEVARRIEADLVIDERALTDEGHSLDDPVSLAVERTPVTARTVLDLLLRPAGATAVNRAGLLHVTTRSSADEETTVRVYNVRDLVSRGRCPSPPAVVVPSGGGFFSAPDAPAARPAAEAPKPAGGAGGERPARAAAPCFDAAALSDVVRETTGDWSYLDDIGSRLAVLDGLLLVKQTPETHAELRGLFAALREAARERRTPPPGPKFACAGRLIEAIKHATEDDNWSDSAGPGLIADADGLLVVRQTAELHARVAGLLDDLRLTTAPASTEGAPAADASDGGTGS